MKHQPQRMCSVCRGIFDKKELLRLVRVEGNLIVDTSGKMNGRGAYICQNPECLAKLKRTKTMKKIFGAEPCDELINSLENGLTQKKNKQNN